jgi:hypothetical protein
VFPSSNNLHHKPRGEEEELGVLKKRATKFQMAGAAVRHRWGQNICVLS